MTATNIQTTIGVDNSTLEVLQNAEINADAGTQATPSSYGASDTVVSGNAEALAKTLAQAAVLNSPITVGLAGILNATEADILSAAATTVSGNAKATAVNDGPTGGILDYKNKQGDISIGTAGTIRVVVDNLSTATATATGGNATSYADVGQKTGLYNIDVAAGTGSSLNAQVNASLKAVSNTVGLPGVDPGNASATAGALDHNYDSSRSEDSDGKSSGTRIVGIYNSGEGPNGDPLKVSFGDSATITARAGSPASVNGTVTTPARPIVISSTAGTVSGDAKANSFAEIVAGISSDNLGDKHSGNSDSEGGEEDKKPKIKPNSLNIAIGNNGTLNASALLSTDATSRAVTGDSDATIKIGTTAGIADERVLRGKQHDGDNGEEDKNGSSHIDGSVVSIGNNGTVLASAAATNVAIATSITAPEFCEVKAEINNEYVVGIAVEKLAIGNDALINSTANSTQSATASSISSGADPIAKVANGDHVLGISNTEIHAGNNLLGLNAAATLVGIANADSVSATAGTTAEAGKGSSVAGINHGSVDVGGFVLNGSSLIGTITANAGATLGATASAVTGPVSATAGGGDECDSATVIGLNSAPVAIGLAGNVAASGNAALLAQATTNTGDAEAHAQELGRGISNSKIAIGTNGSVQGTSALSGSSFSQAITGDAESKLKLDAAGIAQEGQKISIGNNGNVFGRSDVSAYPSSVIGGPSGSTAATTTGEAEAKAIISSKGIVIGAQDYSLQRDGGDGEGGNGDGGNGDGGHSKKPDIAVGNIGNVTGIGIIGNLDIEGVLNGPLNVTATNTTGDSEAFGKFDAAGIEGSAGRHGSDDERGGSHNSTLIQAGPNGGNIVGQAASYGNVLATTVTGEAEAKTKSLVTGISNADLQAGLVIPAGGVPNVITGTAVGQYTTTSASTTGDSEAKSHADIFGLLGDHNSLTVNGDLNAIAQLTNTVTATSVTGNASAEACGSVVGISGYDVHILGSGSITASAINNTTATASTVSA
jgi:hypothetical protein